MGRVNTESGDLTKYIRGVGLGKEQVFDTIWLTERARTRAMLIRVRDSSDLDLLAIAD